MEKNKWDRAAFIDRLPFLLIRAGLLVAIGGRTLWEMWHMFPSDQVAMSVLIASMAAP